MNTTAEKSKSRPEGASALEWIKAVATPLATVLVTVVGGAYVSAYVKERENRDTDERLYAQLLIQREQSDASVRKDMFSLVIREFLTGAKTTLDWHDKVLQLELLASNFNQSIDLAPLFKDIARRMPLDHNLGQDARKQLADRMDTMAAALNFKQVNALKRRGHETSRVIGVGRWESMKNRTFIDVNVPKRKLLPASPGMPGAQAGDLAFQLEIIGCNLDRREIEVRLSVSATGGAEYRLDRHFWVGRYDFPMLDNTQLPDGLRAAVVITSFDVPEAEQERQVNSSAAVHLVVFPSSSASYKERQDYDDVLLDMMRSHSGALQSRGGTR